MFPTLSDLIAYLTGINLPLPIQTFGFLMALSFVGANLATTSELKRFELQGWLKAGKRKEVRNKRVSTSEFAFSIAIGALIGYKLFDAIMNYGQLVDSPQDFILSANGHPVGLMLGGIYAWYLRRKEDKEAAKHQPTEVEVTVHPYQLMWNVVFIAAISGLLGAKVFHNLENMDQFLQDPVKALISFDGLTFYGGLIVASASVLYYTGKQGIPAGRMIDAAAPGLMLAYGIGRLGCQLSGDGDWGIDNLAPLPDYLSFLPEWAWRFDYPHNVINAGIPIPGCEGKHCFHLEVPVYPTPLYESLMCISLAGLLWVIRKRFVTPGLLFSFYLVLNGTERFFIEKIRVNSTYSIFGHSITQAELISSLLVLGGIGSMAYLLLRKKPNA